VTLPIRPDATYLITGGLGGLGLAVACWLVEQGTRRLLLVGRRGPSSIAQEALEALTAQGATVTVMQGDVGDPERVRQILDAVDPAAPLAGIIHSVGVLDDGAILQQTWERFVPVLAPKVQGAWNLHMSTQGMDLDFFVLFSSAASLLGSRGQANHAAANAWLDAFASYRRAQGLQALSINWGAWAEIGAAAALIEDPDGAFAQMGLGAIHPREGIAAFAHLLGRPHTQVGVVPINWSRFLERSGATDGFTTKMRQVVAPRAPTDPLLTTPALFDVRRQSVPSMREALRFDHQEYARRSPDEQQALLVDLLRQTLMRVGGFSAEQVPLTQNLLTIGLDSLMAVEWRLQLEELWAIRIPLSQLLTGGGLITIAHYVMEQFALQSVRSDDRQTPSSPTAPRIDVDPLFLSRIHPDGNDPGGDDDSDMFIEGAL
jgi:NAD(P)-dependent dehydrogenase (short-subunit alcohol dehydrogenase family)/acyl carrier protein